MKRVALLPETGHAGDVGAPEYAFQTKGVEYLVQIVMDAVERIAPAGVAGRTRGLDRNVGILGQRQHIREGLERLCIHDQHC